VFKNEKKQFLSNINFLSEKLKNARICNKDVFKFLADVAFREDRDKQKALIYCDPPYIGTDQANYATDKWCADSLNRLITELIKMGIRFAISEFESDETINLIQRHGLNKIIIGDRCNLKNRKTEILITNYRNQSTLF
jgi:DNA adenine methylase